MKRKLKLAGALLGLLAACGGIYWWLTRPQLLFAGFAGPFIGMMFEASGKTGVKFDFWGRKQMDDPSLDAAKLSRYKAIFVSGLRAEPLTEPMKSALIAAQNKGIKVIVIPPAQGNSLGVGNADYEGLEKPVKQYWAYAGKDNMRRFFNYSAAKYLGASKPIEEPQPTPEDGFYHPDAPDHMLTTDAYRAWYKQTGKWKEKASHVVIDFADGWKVGSVAGTNALLRAFEKKGWNAAAIFGKKNTVEYTKQWKPDIMISRTHGRWYQGNRGVEILKNEIDIPVMRGLALFFTGEMIGEYKQTSLGIRGAGLAIGAIVPELDGSIEPTLIEGIDAEWYGKRYEAVIDERIDRMTDRAARWVRLRKAPNAEKKLAVIYVAGMGKGKITAASMNVPESMRDFLGSLKNAGYRVNRIPANSEALVAELNERGRNLFESQEGELEELAKQPGTELVPAEEYAAWFQKLPEKLSKPVVDTYGPAPGRNMVIVRGGKQFVVIPKLDFGNVIILPQPARGASMSSKLVHDDKVPPPHQYLAVYWWLQHKFKADALVNYGTHGTHEFLPGRPVGQLDDDWSDRTLGVLPNIYVYVMDNVGEALIAKRRGSAVTISYQTPPIVAAEISATDAQAAELYRATQQFNAVDEGALKDKLREQIRDLAVKRKFDRDIKKDFTKSAPTDADVAELDAHLDALEEERIPVGLHTHSRADSGEQLAPALTEILGDDFVKRAGGKKQAMSLVRTAMTSAARSIVSEAPVHEPAHKASATWNRTTEPKPLRGDNDTARVQFLQAAFAETSLEIPQTLRALEGHFIPPGSGGDPVRNPNALPTGRNLYGINPQEVPTRAAWELGKKLAADLIAAEQRRLGRFPRKVGFTLWNTELIRHYGADLAQVLYLMGLQPRWDKRGIVEGVNVIPMSELKRPRVDVVIQAASLFRDTFPDRMEFLDQAVRIAAEVRDGENYIAENNAANEKALKDSGMSAKDAKLYAAARVFSNAPGGYGTGVIGNIERSGDYTDTKAISDEYMAKTGAVYTAGAEWGKAVPQLYKQQLAGTDSVALSRSSNVTSALSLDHYFEYLGGMTMAIRDTTGKSPETYVTDVRDAKRAKMLTTQQALAQDFRTRYFNKKWIEGQQKEGFSGASEIRETTKNLFGWQVTKPEAIDSWVWDEAEKVYVQDSLNLGLKQWFDEKNPYAYQEMTATMLESARKGFWKPSAEVLQRLANEYAASVSKHGAAGAERMTNNSAFEGYLKQQLNAPGNVTGMQLTSSYRKSIEKAAGGSNKLIVAGQRLTRENATPNPTTQSAVRYSAFAAAAIGTLAALFYFGTRRKKDS